MLTNKKGVELSISTIITAIILLIVLVVLVMIFIGYVRKTEPYYGGTLDSLADESCKARGYQMKVKGVLTKENDIDEDDRPDFVCDLCLCTDNKCPNGFSSNNDLDKNGNNVPDGCEDTGDKEDPWWDGCKKVDKKEALEGKPTGNVVLLDKNNNLWQCKLGMTTPRTTPTSTTPTITPTQI